MSGMADKPWLKQVAYLIAFMGIAGPARAAFDPAGYSSHAQFLVSGYEQSLPLNNFPVLISLSTNLPGFRYSQFESPPAADLRFTDATGNELNSEIEQWNTAGTSLAWVQLPVLTNGACINMYWGKSGETVPAYRTNGSTFSDGIFEAVWHMQTRYVTDSSGHGYNATYIPVPSAITSTDGLIGTAQDFDGTVGSDNRIRISQSLQLANQTLSAWIRMEDSSREGVVMTKEGQMFLWQQGNALRFETAPWGGDTTYRVDLAGGTGKWIHFAAVQNGLQATLYINGSAAGSWTKSTAPAQGTEWFNLGGGWGRLFNGQIDECRAESAPRSSEWIQACYQNQRSPDDFLDFVPEPGILTADRMNGSDLHLSWPDRGERLVTAPGLESSWTTNGIPAPVFDGESNHVAVTIDGPAAFFRLIPQRRDFALELSSNHLVVTQGLASSVSVSVAGLNGFNKPVSLSVSNAPPGISTYLHPSSLRSGSSLLTLEIPSSVPAGDYTLEVHGTGGLNAHATSLAVTVAADAAGTPFTWPAYSPNLNYNFTSEYPDIAPPTMVLDDDPAVVDTYADGWFCFRYGADMNPLVTSNAWIPMIERLNEEFSYFRNVMGWPPDKRAKNGYYSAVYLFGSGLSTDSASNTDTGGWQSSIYYNGESWPMGLLSYYPVYSFDPACPYNDAAAQRGAVVHEMIHSVLADMPGCRNAAWFHEGGNTWLQGTAEAQRSGDFSSMGWLSAAAMIAPFMPIECYTGWLQDGSFGGPSAEGVNRFEGSQQICTWRNLLGGTQYGEAFPHFMGEMVSEGSVAWIWQNCTNRVLEGLATVPTGLGEYQTRRLIKEYRARAAFCDFGTWSGAYKSLLNGVWGSTIGPEWEPKWIDCDAWTARCYAVTTNSGGVLTPEARTLPGWSGANQIPLTTATSTGTVTIDFTPLGENMSCQLVYRATDGSVIYSKPVSSGSCSLTPPAGKAIRNNVVIAVICNTDFIYDGESSRTTKYDYRLQITGAGTAGITGKANIATKWYQ